MILAQLLHRPVTGWSGRLPIELDGPNTLLLAFGDTALLDRPGPLQALAQAFPQALRLGCSTAGDIVDRQIGDENLSITLAHFERSRLRWAGTALKGADDSRAAGARLAAQLPADDLRAVWMLSPGLNVNGTALVSGLREGLPAQVRISGGLAGDGARFERSWVLTPEGPQEKQICAVGFYGPHLSVGLGCGSGWLEFGPERRITRSEGHVLHELDGLPALARYKLYLGDLAEQLPGSALRVPLALRRGDGEPVVRTILGVDEAQQAMIFAGDMPAGSSVRLMRTSQDRLVASAEDAGFEALGQLSRDRPALALSVSCIGRRLVMGERTEEELDAVAEQLPPGSVHAGFYSYGEISASLNGQGAQLHNQTLTLTLLSED